MTGLIVITENGRAGGPESQIGGMTFPRAGIEVCGNVVSSRVTSHLME